MRHSMGVVVHLILLLCDQGAEVVTGLQAHDCTEPGSRVERVVIALVVPGLYLLAGILACTMLYALASAAARRSLWPQFACAATALLAALGAAVFAAQSLQAASDAGYLRALKSTFDCLFLAAPALLAFLLLYSGRTVRAARLVTSVYALICLALIALNEALPYGVSYASFAGIAHATVPWGERMVLGRGRGGTATVVSLVALYGLFPYAAFDLFRCHRRRHRAGAPWLLAALAAAGVLGLQGALGHLWGVSGIEAAPGGFLFLIAAMGVVLAWESRHELLGSARYYRALFESCPDALVVLEPRSGRILEANAFARGRIGYDARELSSKSVSDLLVPQELSVAMHNMADLVSGRTDIVRAERQCVCKDGRIVLTDCAVAAWQDASGEVKGLIARLSDITDRKHIENALQDSERKLRSLFELSPLGIVLNDLEGHYIEFNRAFESICGYSAEELLTMPRGSMTPNEYLAEEEGITSQLRRTGRYGPYEKHYLRKDGTRIPVRLNGVQFTGSDGKRYTWSIIEDISADRRAQEALERESAKNRLLLRNASDGIHILDRQGNVIEASDSFCEMLGYARDEIIGMNVRRWDAQLSDEELAEVLRVDFSGSGRRVIETRHRRRDGSLFDVEISSVSMRLNDVQVLFNSARDITERRKTEERIRQLAFFDQLTQLPNRELLQDRLRQALSISARSAHFGALLILNLDNFKAVNDTLGHAAGDVLLQQVATRLAAEVREGDTLARVDSDEFVVLLEELGAQPVRAAAAARAFGLKMMAALSGSYALPGGEIHVGCSVGATILSGGQQTTDDLIRQVNVALHQAKKAGRNAFRFFDPRMQSNVNSRAVLEGELRKAVDAGQFVLYYQIQVDESGRPIGAEALLRWHHPERGMIPPGEFIALAEEAHMILPIGAWIIEAACAQLSAWSRQPHARELSLAVNVSPLQFQQPDFASEVLGAIGRHGIEAHRLKLEVTETLLQRDLERTVEAMRVLKAQGVQFSLDDFGTGYSSLQYLKRLPLDQLKIDQSFVHDIAGDADDKAIVTTIVAMANHLGLDVIAEGVETLEQLEVLRHCGCTRYQGYLFGRPVPAEELFAAHAAPRDPEGPCEDVSANGTC